MNLLPAFIATAAALVLSSAAQAQTWPTLPIKIIVPYAAGGAGDIIARTTGDAIARDLKQPIVVENKPGASGMLGGAACKSALPDGHTFCLFLMDVVTINPYLFKKVPYNAETDFVPVAYVAEPTAVLPVPASLPVTNLKELVTYANAHPGKLNWGSYGVGTTSHLVLEMLNKRFNTSITHVPYQNTPMLITATLNAEVDITLAAYAQVQQYIDQKKMRVIAVLGNKRLAQLPDVATLVEQGVDFQAATWFGLFAPAGTPPDAVRRMNEAVTRAVADPAVVKFFQTASIGVRPMGAADFASVVKRDTALWQGIVKQAKLSLD